MMIILSSIFVLSGFSQDVKKEDTFWDHVPVSGTNGHLRINLDRIMDDGSGKLVISINDFFREGFSFPFYVVDAEGRPTEVDTSGNYVCYGEDNLFFDCISFDIRPAATDYAGREVYRFQIIDSGGRRSRYWVKQYTPESFYNRNPELLKILTEDELMESRRPEGAL